MQQFDRQKIHRFPLQTRISKSSIDKIAILPDSPCPDISQELDTKLQQIAQKIIQAKKKKKHCSYIWSTFNKNGLGIYYKYDRESMDYPFNNKWCRNNS